MHYTSTALLKDAVQVKTSCPPYPESGVGGWRAAGIVVGVMARAGVDLLASVDEGRGQGMIEAYACRRYGVPGMM